MKPIIIDGATIFDPARLIAVLSAVDIRYSEVWVSQKYDHFKEKDYITGFGTDSKFGLIKDPVLGFKADPIEVPKINEKLDPKSWTTGPKILRWAFEKGIAVPKDLYKYNSFAIELEKANNLNELSEAIMLGPPAEYDIRAGKERTEEYLKKTGQSKLGAEYAWRLEPYGIGHGLGLILAAALEENVEPFFSHPYFIDNSSQHNYNFYKKDESLTRISGEQIDKELPKITIQNSIKDAKRVLKSPELISISEVANFLKQKERIQSIEQLINVSKEIENRNKDIGIIATKYAGTVAADTFIFGGLPLSTTLVSIYDIGARYFKSKKK
jgi:hypothetical protein